MEYELRNLIIQSLYTESLEDSAKINSAFGSPQGLLGYIEEAFKASPTEVENLFNDIDKTNEFRNHKEMLAQFVQLYKFITDKDGLARTMKTDSSVFSTNDVVNIFSSELHNIKSEHDPTSLPGKLIKNLVVDPLKKVERATRPKDDPSLDLGDDTK